MPDTTNSKWLTLIFGGVISIIVGISSGYGVNWLSEKKAELSYDITSIQAFPGQERIGIIAVKVINSGKKELENIDASFRFPDSEVKEVLFQGLTPQSSSKDENGIRFQLPFLNPSENFTVQILVSPKSESLQPPQIDLRAKGAVGVLFNPDVEEKFGKYGELTMLFVSALGTFLAVQLGFRFRNNALRLMGAQVSELGHSGDQRDIFAYVLGFYGLTEDAELIRKWPRELTYWSISDVITERWISLGDPKVLSSGYTALSQIINYAHIARESQRILQLNLARLSLELNDLESAVKHIGLATSVKDNVISNRIKIDEKLKALLNKI